MKIIVIGPENSGSKLVARICAEVTGICKFENWNGIGYRGPILHKSYPYWEQNTPKNLQIKKYINQGYKFILTSRDINISGSKYPAIFDNYTRKDFMKNVEVLREHVKLLDSKGEKYYFFSLESLVLYREMYLKELYRFLGVESDFCPEIKNPNKKYIIEDISRDMFP